MKIKPKKKTRFIKPLKECRLEQERIEKHGKWVLIPGSIGNLTVFVPNKKKL